MPDVDTLRDAFREEVEAVHRFIAAWFRGEGPRSADAFSAGLGARIAPGLVYIQPSGRVLTRETLLPFIETSHGANPDFRIAVDDVRIHYAGSDDHVLATYVESQTGALNSARENSRLSTVLVRHRPKTGTWEWLHIHETALPADR